MNPGSASGILLINKPRGLTSFGVVSRLRRLTGVKRIGHCGTLDPFAEGLLPICVGRATAAVQFMDGYDKTYRVRVTFGLATDTMDLTGQPILTHIWQPGELEAWQADDFARLREAVARLEGDHLQLPPMYSAVKVDGRPLYAYARAGREIERAARPIRIDQARIQAIACRLADNPAGPGLELDLSIACSKGTYIRVIADDLGQTLGCGAHASRLVRERVGPYRLDQALDLEALIDEADELPGQTAFWQRLQARGQVHSLASACAEFPVLHLTNRQAFRLISGQGLTLTQADFRLQAGGRPPDSQARYALTGHAGLIGIGRVTPAWAPADSLAAAAGPADYQIHTERVFVDLGDYRQP